VLVAGGEDSLSAPLATTEIDDPNANAWTPSANTNGPRAGGLLVLLPDARLPRRRRGAAAPGAAWLCWLIATNTFIARPFPAINDEFPVRQTTFLAPGASRRARGGLRARLEKRDISPTWALVRWSAIALASQA
jgi:hypothetical protein